MYIDFISTESDTAPSLMSQFLESDPDSILIVRDFDRMHELQDILKRLGRLNRLKQIMAVEQVPMKVRGKTIGTIYFDEWNALDPKHRSAALLEAVLRSRSECVIIRDKAGVLLQTLLDNNGRFTNH